MTGLIKHRPVTPPELTALNTRPSLIG